MSGLRTVPITFAQATSFVTDWHRRPASRTAARRRFHPRSHPNGHRRYPQRLLAAVRGGLASLVEDEPGSSLRAAGWTVVAHRPASPGWSRPSRPRGDHTGRRRWQAPTAADAT